MDLSLILKGALVGTIAGVGIPIANRIFEGPGSKSTCRELSPESWPDTFRLALRAGSGGAVVGAGCTACLMLGIQVMIGVMNQGFKAAGIPV